MSLSHPGFWPEIPSSGEIEALCSARAEAAQALGRLDGLLGTLPVDALPFFTARLLRNTLMAALRQEGHGFTDARFFAWFAGLTPLCDETLNMARAPRAIAATLLGEIAHCPWEPLGVCANRFGEALSAFGTPHDRETREAVQTSLDEARRLVTSLRPAPLPFSALASLHEMVGQSLSFAPVERAIETLRIDNLSLIVERPRPPAPCWPIEILFGTYLHQTGALPVALPLTSLIRHDALRPTEDRNPPMVAIAQAQALRDSLIVITDVARHARFSLTQSSKSLKGQRSNSRTPHLWALLEGFGPLRSSQIEHLLGVTRLGVRGILVSLAKTEALDVQIINGVKLYSLTMHRPAHSLPSAAEQPLQFSKETLDDYDASLARIDALLARHHGPSDPKI